MAVENAQRETFSIDIVTQIDCYLGALNECRDYAELGQTVPRTLQTASNDALSEPRTPRELALAIARFERFIVTRDPVAAARYRDSIVSSLMIASERNCGIYLSNLRAWQVAHRSALGLAEIAVDTAGAITTNTVTSRVMSGLSGVATATSGRIDAEVFASTAVELIAAQIVTEMEAGRTAIRGKLGSTYSTWSLPTAISEVERVHQQCDIRVGLARLRQNNALGTLNAEAQTAREALGASALLNQARHLSAQAEAYEIAAAGAVAEREALERSLTTARAADLPFIQRRIAELNTNAQNLQRRAQELRDEAAALRVRDQTGQATQQGGAS